MLAKTEIIRNKIISKETLSFVLSGWRVKNKKIVFTNGCFDILHKGHVSLLLQAADAGSKLIIGLNSDASVKRLKGETRPINNQEDRALLLAAQAYVDAVVVFDEDTPLDLIRMVLPDILVKGGDYTEDQVAGAKDVIENGGKVMIVPLETGYSTTKIVEAK